MKKSSLPENVNGEELARLLGVDVRTVRNHVSAGTITRSGPNKYHLGEAIRGIISAAKKIQQKQRVGEGAGRHDGGKTQADRAAVGA